MFHRAIALLGIVLGLSCGLVAAEPVDARQRLQREIEKSLESERWHEASKSFILAIWKDFLTPTSRASQRRTPALLLANESRKSQVIETTSVSSVAPQTSRIASSLRSCNPKTGDSALCLKAKISLPSPAMVCFCSQQVMSFIRPYLNWAKSRTPR